jgi:hypothetical protein
LAIIELLHQSFCRRFAIAGSFGFGELIPMVVDSESAVATESAVAFLETIDRNDAMSGSATTLKMKTEDAAPPLAVDTTVAIASATCGHLKNLDVLECFVGSLSDTANFVLC